MNKKYIFLAALLILMAFGLLVLPERHDTKQIKPEELMIDIVQPTRYVSVDQVARMIIENDPNLRLVDVRKADEYAAYSLPGSFNIPVDSVISPSAIEQFSEKGTNIVFYGNDDLKADQVWVILRRLGFKNIYVMKGGLNDWFSSIVQPVPPSETASEAEFELYNQRKGASMFFTGAKIETSEIKTEVKVSRKAKSGVAEGGC